MRSPGRRVLLSVLLIFPALLIVVNWRWLPYLYQLARHQASVILYKEPIAERLRAENLPVAERKALESTLKIRAFIEKQYAITNSISYRSYYALGRAELGFNITLAPAFSLKAESFNFFPFGRFDYLGFFDKELAEAWAQRYRDAGFDVHLSEIGGYSTLGWFEDPLYSSQLDWGDYGLARLLGHEIAHERLYFKGDTTSSELLASFIERKIAADYVIAEGQPFPGENEQARAQAKAKEFYGLIDVFKSQLEILYKTEMPAAKKLEEKQMMFQKFKDQLNRRQTEFAQVSAARELSRLKEINNATLIQFRRYAAVNVVLQQTYDACLKRPEGKYVCWFSELDKLQSCTPEKRKAWLSATEAAAAPCPD
jgi:predicted aminopeptidase